MSNTNLVDGYFRLSNTALSGQSIVLEYRYVNTTTIEFRASLPLSHSEWFGLGLDSDSTMPDADNKIVFWNEASQSTHTTSDRFSVARSTPRIDAEENIGSSNLSFFWINNMDGSVSIK